MRVGKYYGLSVKQLDLSFDCPIMSIFTYGIELWGCAYYSKYLNQVDKLINCVYKYGYMPGRASIKQIINKRNKKLWNKITSITKNALQELLPDKRVKPQTTGPWVWAPSCNDRTLKKSFINRCLFNLVYRCFIPTFNVIFNTVFMFNFIVSFFFEFLNYIVNM